MGIPKFYRWISERYPCLSEVINETQVPEFDCLYLDMNGIIHVCSHPSDDVHFRMSEKEMFVDICRYIEVLFRIISPKRTFFMAVDGVAPRAKMNQQRARRFKTAKEMEKKEEEAKAKGESLPEEPPFDSNCITPGTSFMDRLHKQLNYFTAQKISTDTKWQNVQIILSGHDVPGEGEHKIMDFIRSERSKPDYDPNTRHCMYGLDADLLMLGLCSHEPHFSLLREEVRFGKFAQHGKQNSRVSNADRTTFHLLHLSLLREYLEMEFSILKETLSFEFDIEKIIDDWVMMGFLVGNDFLPHLPYLHINRNALPILYSTYVQVLPQLNGYLNENGYLNLERFEVYCKALGEVDRNYFDEINEDMQWMKSKRLGDAIVEHHETHISPTNSSSKKPNSSSTCNNDDERWLQKLESGFLFDEDDEGECLETDTAESMTASNVKVTNQKSDVTELRRLFSHEFNQSHHFNGGGTTENNEEDLSQDNLEYLHWKRAYYIEKFNEQNPSVDFIRNQVEIYIRAIQWNLHYYYHGVQSWSWFYSEHYAPFASDLRNITNIDLSFDLSQPFKPFEQLLAVLPARSSVHLPSAYASLMTEGPIVDFYPTDFAVDLNGKQMDWEAVVLIPFIDEKRLLEAMSHCTHKLTVDEIARNKRGFNLLFTYDSQTDLVLPEVAHFQSMQHCKAKITSLDFDVWSIPKHIVKHGLVEGVQLDVYFEGFPTMKHLNYRSELRTEGVRVFQSNSRSENMIITVSSSSQIKSVEDARDLFFTGGNSLNNTVYIRWPYLKEAKAVAVSDTVKRYKFDEEGNIVCKELDKKEKTQQKNQLNDIIDWYHNKRGVVIEKREEKSNLPIIVEVVELVGRKNVYHGKTGTVTLEPRYASNIEVYPLELCVSGISTKKRQVEHIRTLPEMFPAGSTVFVIGSSLYGEEGVVLDCLPDSTVKFQCCQKLEPNFDDIIRNKEILANQYFSQLDVARHLGIPPLLVGRITGSLFVLPPFQPHLNEATTSEPQTEESKPQSKQHSGGNNNNPSSSNGIGWCQNLGLNLKFTKSNEEVMGFTKRIGNDEHVPTGGGGWLYSEKCVHVIREYMDKFPELFDALRQCCTGDKFKAEDIFGSDNAANKMEAILNYLKGVSCAKAKKISCNSQILEEQVLIQIQKEIERCNIANHDLKRKMTAKCSPAHLFRPSDLNGSLMPDESTQFRMFDRVVNVRDGFCVPVGLRGTVIGLPTKTPSTSRDAMLDVLFDEPFLGAHQAMPGTWFSAYRVPATSLINLSHGRRKTKNDSRNGPPKVEARIMPKQSTLNASLNKSLYQSNKTSETHQSDQKSGTSVSTGLKELLSQAATAAVNEKMYQKSKLNQSSDSAFKTPTLKHNSAMNNSRPVPQQNPSLNNVNHLFRGGNSSNGPNMAQATDQVLLNNLNNLLSVHSIGDANHGIPSSNFYNQNHNMSINDSFSNLVQQFGHSLQQQQQQLSHQQLLSQQQQLQNHHHQQQQQQQHQYKQQSVFMCNPSTHAAPLALSDHRETELQPYVMDDNEPSDCLEWNPPPQSSNLNNIYSHRNRGAMGNSSAHMYNNRRRQPYYNSNNATDMQHLFSKPVWGDGREYSCTNLSDVEQASQICAPFSELLKRHQLGTFSNKPTIDIQKFQTGFGCSLHILDKRYDGPLCESEIEALTEASFGLIKLLNAELFSQCHEPFMTAPGLYEPKQLLSSQNYLNGGGLMASRGQGPRGPVLLNQNDALVNSHQQPVLVPGQVRAQYFTPASFDPNSFEAYSQSSVIASNSHNENFHQQLNEYEAENGAAYNAQTGSSNSSGGNTGNKRGTRSSGRGKRNIRGAPSNQNCAMNFNN